MALPNVVDLATSLIATAPSPALSGGSLGVTTGEGAYFPATASGSFYATVHPADARPTKANSEIVKVTARATDTFTITRAQKGTTAKAIAVGWVISQGIYIDDLLSLQRGLNVMDYGAAGNNVGDDGPAIQDAVDDAIASGLPVYFPTGIYPVSTQITVTDSVVLVGDGADNSVLKAGNAFNDYIVEVNSANQDVRIQMLDLTFDGNCGNQTTGGGGVWVNGAVEGKYENLHFINCFNYGMVLTNFLLDDAFGHHNRVVNCLFDTTLANAGIGGGLWMDSCDENLILGCNFQYLGGSGSATPHMIKDSAGLQLIQNCVFVGARGGAMDVRGVWLDTGNRSNVIGCVFDGVGGDNIFVKGQFHTISGCRFTYPGDQGAAGYHSAIHLEFGARQCVIVACQFDAADAGAIGTRSYIRESIGDPGENFIVGCVFAETGVLNVGALELAAGTTPKSQVVGCVPYETNTGTILTSPNGTQYQLNVSNAGALSAVAF